MDNPIKIGRELKNSYLQYIKAGIPLMEKYYEDERNRMYEKDGVIMQPPYIEIVKKYEGRKTLSEIFEENGLNTKTAEFINSGLLHNNSGEERKLYEHQERAIVEVIKNKKNMVITTGTGSGKTEAFLIPLLTNIVEESFTWQKQEAAMRSIIFYPLNALAEDQMVRLRKSLERQEIKEWYQKNGITRHITFGRYIGRTPKNKSDRKYKEIENRWNSIKNIIDNPNNENQLDTLKELIYSGPCCGKDSAEIIAKKIAEIIDRESMQKTPPDILITNYSMLNIMLMRKEEQSLFEETRKWLSQNEKNIFTLVIDELHTYRGTAGTEVAYIIKVLLHRLGLSPTSPQVRFLASSASMDASQESEKYISDFFGTQFSSFSLIPDDKTAIVMRKSLPGLPIQELKEIAGSGSCENAIEAYFKTDHDAITQFVEKHKLVDWLTYALQDKESGTIYAKSIIDIGKKIFDANKYEEKLLEIILLLINRSKGTDGLSLQPLRAHYFLRNIEKIYMCINKNCDTVDPEFKDKNRQYGKMYNTPITRCSCGSLVYEAIVCRHCGEIYFCGYLDPDKKLINVPDIFNPSKPEVLYKADKKLFPDGKIEDWTKVNFNCMTGKIEKSRYGEYYQYSLEERSDFPTTCPRCEFSTKRYKTSDFSALFRHGTGVQKVNQVCADTIMQIMSGSGEARKLVIFSDSRQSAAKLSAGIELDHYRDALRQTILTSFELYSSLLIYLIRWWDGTIKNYFNKDEVPEDIKKAIEDDKYLNDISNDIMKIKFKESSGGDIDPLEKEKLDRKLSVIYPTLEYIIDNIMKNLIASGINPAGSYPSYYKNNQDKKWYHCLNDEGTAFKTDTKQLEDFYQKIYNACHIEILKVMIGNPKRSFESLGLGYYHIQDTIEGISPELLDSILRILGESNRIYSNSMEEQEHFPNRLYGYLKAVKGETIKNHPILDIIKQEFIKNKVIRDAIDLRLTGENIVFIPAKEGSDVWICPICNTKHLHHSEGKCTYCFSALPQDPEKLAMEQTYYTQKRAIHKLHCEELTGQTDTQDALDRQRLFQDICYENKNKEIDNIEILSVTTTMEAGVDIGQLSAVMMGNVPPQRFNYQQRVGRAGRRGSPLSIALTVSRASSHDQMHYANPERIVSGEPLPPYLDFSSKDIFKRIVYKELLRNAFCGILTNKSDSVHGQFGYVSDWNKNKPIISKWLEEQNISEKYSYLISPFENENDKKEKTDILKEISKKIISDIDSTLTNTNFNQLYLSERLAAGGRLPMFGFPTQVRNLYEAKPKRFPVEDDVTDRPMDLALAKFAPGSEIVKDKKVFTSVGFIDFKKNGRDVEISDGLNKYKDKVLYRCPECGCTGTAVLVNQPKCPICDHTFNENKGEICKDICSPRGYCVNFSEPPKDFDGNFNWNPITISSMLDSEITREIKLESVENTNLKLGNNSIPDRGVVRTVNTNNGKFFTIRNTFDNGWVVPDLVKDKNVRFKSEEQRRIALVTTKITGIILLAIDSDNEKICINPLFKGSIEAINQVRPQLLKSAFLSWGELVRRAVSDYLDIRNNELSADYSIRRDKGDKDSIYPIVYMMEHLENGAGYTDYLASLPVDKKHKVFIEPLLEHGKIYQFLTGIHQNQCDTSCYDCLCDYYNQQKHGLLNWRLGLDIAKLSAHNNYLPRYTDEGSYWHSILTKTEKIIEKNSTDTKLIKEDPFWYTKSEDKIHFIYHPLWSEDYIKNESKKIKYSPDKIQYVSLLEFINNPL